MLLILHIEEGRPPTACWPSVMTKSAWPEKFWFLTPHVHDSQSHFQAAMIVWHRTQYGPGTMIEAVANSQSDQMLTSRSGCCTSPRLSLPGGWVGLSGQRGNSHFLRAGSWFLWVNGLEKNIWFVSLAFIHLFMHGGFVPGITQACNIQNSNKLKISSAEISTSYFPAGVRSRLFTEYLKWLPLGPIHCRQFHVLYLLSVFFQISKPSNLPFSVYHQLQWFVCQLSKSGNNS